MRKLKNTNEKKSKKLQKKELKFKMKCGFEPVPFEKYKKHTRYLASEPLRSI